MAGATVCRYLDVTRGVRYATIVLDYPYTLFVGERRYAGRGRSGRLTKEMDEGVRD